MTTIIIESVLIIALIFGFGYKYQILKNTLEYRNQEVRLLRAIIADDLTRAKKVGE